MSNVLRWYRIVRIFIKKIIGLEPNISVKKKINLQYHGNLEYGGWAIPSNLINKKSIIVDVGLGEDISFSQSIINSYGCIVHGFDPTPKAIAYVKALNPRKFILHEYGLGGTTREAQFFLPNITTHVSGSIAHADHVGTTELKIQLLGIEDLFDKIKVNNISILKIDIEGAEYELLKSKEFVKYASQINIICIEFHHRWREFGNIATIEAVEILEKLGFICVWGSRSSNEEFTFLRCE
ncbi:MAG: hypothetical protein CVU30_00545 [Betaproteobacteria bacterium HGW-Betaproteobacteria-3]|jgi:FkbM family methyltransferase|nr:MAG: hypothetical protein CVU30_00545 [Betaproteobacteria bacterium HGW-Betaproteobacteria-3]